MVRRIQSVTDLPLQIDCTKPDAVEAALGKVISAKHADMKDVNRRAISLGASL